MLGYKRQLSILELSTHIFPNICICISQLDAMKQSIGYPAFIKDPTKLNNMYKMVSCLFFYRSIKEYELKAVPS